MRRAFYILNVAAAVTVAGFQPSAAVAAPQLDDPQKPWSYFVHPVTCIGMPLQTARTGIQVTPEGTVFTGEHELALFFGDERRPLACRQRRFVDDMPIVEDEWRDGDCRYRWTLFGTTLPCDPRNENTAVFARLEVRNVGAGTATPKIWASMKASGGFRREGRAPFNASWRYRFSGVELWRGDEGRERLQVIYPAGADAKFAALGEPSAVPPPLPAKVAKPLRAAIYADKGGSNVAVAELLALAPEYELRVLDAEDYRKGALDGVDLLVQPGGLSKVQHDTLGPEGVAALKRYVTDGGRYYGICAGAFLASQPVPPTERGMSRLGLVPFKADSPDHYRGWAPMKVAFTDEGRASLGLTSKNRTMMYWGGPAFLDGDPVPDSDVKVWGRYVGRIVNTHSSRPIEDMSGKAALVGGRVGKGRVFVTCPHPEKNESNLDVVKGGIKYLTGVEPSAVNHDRVRGAVSVFFRSAKEKPAAELYLGTLLRDRRLDVRGGSHLYADMLPHLDVVVLPSALEEEDEAIAFLGEFVARGGRVVVVADTEKKRKLSEKIPGAIAVASYDGVVGAIL